MSFFWGDTPLSWLRFLSLKSCRLMNPDLEIRLFTCSTPQTVKSWDTPEQQDFFGYQGKDYRSELASIGVEARTWSDSDIPASWELGASHMSNLFKWKLLAEQGGIYADMDILFVRPFGERYDKMTRADASLSYFQGYLSIGLLGAAPGSHVFRAIYEHALSCYTPARYQSAGVESVYDLMYGALMREAGGPADYWQALAEHDLWLDLQARFAPARFFNIPEKWVYPWRWNEMEHVFVERHALADLPEDTMGIHWYAGTELAQQWNRELTPENVGEQEFTAARVIRELGLDG